MVIMAWAPSQVHVVLHAFWHVVVHVPVELCICVSILQDALVQILYTSHTSLVGLNGVVDTANECGEVALVLIGNLCILGILLLEPCDNIRLIIAKCEGWLI